VAALTPMAANHSGWAMGWLIAKDSSSRTSASAPTSAHVTDGAVLKPSRRTAGCTFPTAALKSPIVIARSLLGKPRGLRWQVDRVYVMGNAYGNPATTYNDTD